MQYRDAIDRYVPDWWNESNRDYIMNELLSDSNVHRGKLPSRPETAYVDDGIITRSGIAIHDVLTTIDWHSLPVEDEALNPPSSKYNATERGHVRWYTRVRNAICHSALLEVGRDPEQAVAGELDRLRGPPENASYEDVLNTLAALDVAPTIRKDSALAYSSPREALKEKAREEGQRAATNWELQEDALPHTVLADEVKYVTETAQRAFVGGQIDRIAHLHNYDSPATIEIKVTSAIHPSHLLQAETARRAAAELLGEEVIGVVLRITPEGQYEILTSNDDGWPKDVLWDAVCRRSKHVYDRLKPHLTTAERRLL